MYFFASMLKSLRLASDQNPPPYQMYSQLGIKATDTPQWLWSNVECRAWLTAVGVTLLNMSIDEAEGYADSFEGSGTYIYNWNCQAWHRLYGIANGK